MEVLNFFLYLFIDWMSKGARFRKSRSSPERDERRRPSKAFRYPSLNSAFPNLFSLTATSALPASEKRRSSRFSKKVMMSSWAFLDAFSPRFLEILVPLHASLSDA